MRIRADRRQAGPWLDRVKKLFKSEPAHKKHLKWVPEDIDDVGAGDLRPGADARPIHEFGNYVEILSDRVGPDGVTQGTYALAHGKSGNIGDYPLPQDPDDEKAVFLANGTLGVVRSMGANSVIVDFATSMTGEKNPKKNLFHIDRSALRPMQKPEERLRPLEPHNDLSASASLDNQSPLWESYDHETDCSRDREDRDGLHRSYSGGGRRAALALLRENSGAGTSQAGRSVRVVVRDGSRSVQRLTDNLRYRIGRGLVLFAGRSDFKNVSIRDWRKALIAAGFEPSGWNGDHEVFRNKTTGKATAIDRDHAPNVDPNLFVKDYPRETGLSHDQILELLGRATPSSETTPALDPILTISGEEFVVSPIAGYTLGQTTRDVVERRPDGTVILSDAFFDLDADARSRALTRAGVTKQAGVIDLKGLDQEIAGWVIDEILQRMPRDWKRIYSHSGNVRFLGKALADALERAGFDQLHLSEWPEPILPDPDADAKLKETVIRLVTKPLSSGFTGTFGHRKNVSPRIEVSLSEIFKEALTRNQRPEHILTTFLGHELLHAAEWAYDATNGSGYRSMRETFTPSPGTWYKVRKPEGFLRDFERGEQVMITKVSKGKVTIAAPGKKVKLDIRNFLDLVYDAAIVGADTKQTEDQVAAYYNSPTEVNSYANTVAQGLIQQLGTKVHSMSGAELSNAVNNGRWRNLVSRLTPENRKKFFDRVVRFLQTMKSNEVTQTIPRVKLGSIRVVAGRPPVPAEAQTIVLWAQQQYAALVLAHVRKQRTRLRDSQDAIRAATQIHGQRREVLERLQIGAQDILHIPVGSRGWYIAIDRPSESTWRVSQPRTLGPESAVEELTGNKPSSLDQATQSLDYNLRQIAGNLEKANERIDPDLDEVAEELGYNIEPMENDTVRDFNDLKVKLKSGTYEMPDGYFVDWGTQRLISINLPSAEIRSVAEYKKRQQEIVSIVEHEVMHSKQSPTFGRPDLDGDAYDAKYPDLSLEFFPWLNGKINEFINSGQPTTSDAIRAYIASDSFFRTLKKRESPDRFEKAVREFYRAVTDMSSRKASMHIQAKSTFVPFSKLEVGDAFIDPSSETTFVGVKHDYWTAKIRGVLRSFPAKKRVLKLGGSGGEKKKASVQVMAGRKTLERLKKLHPDKLDILDTLAAGDPTNNHDWLEWMFKAVVREDVDPKQVIDAVHDLDRYGPALKEEKGLTRIPNPNDWATYKQLASDVTELKERGHQPKLRKQDAEYDIVYQDDQVTLYDVKNKAASCVLGSDSNWCSSKWDKDWYEKRKEEYGGKQYIARYENGDGYMVRVVGGMLVTAFDKRDNSMLPDTSDEIGNNEKRQLAESERLADLPETYHHLLALLSKLGIINYDLWTLKERWKTLPDKELANEVKELDTSAHGRQIIQYGIASLVGSRPNIVLPYMDQHQAAYAVAELSPEALASVSTEVLRTVLAKGWMLTSATQLRLAQARPDAINSILQATKHTDVMWRLAKDENAYAALARNGDEDAQEFAAVRANRLDTQAYLAQYGSDKAKRIVAANTTSARILDILRGSWNPMVVDAAKKRSAELGYGLGPAEGEDEDAWTAREIKEDQARRRVAAQYLSQSVPALLALGFDAAPVIDELESPYGSMENIMRYVPPKVHALNESQRAAVMHILERSGLYGVISTPEKVKTAEAFHGTYEVFELIDPDRSGLGAHFGTYNAAVERLNERDLPGFGEKPGRVMLYELDVKRPLKMDDMGTWDRGIWQAVRIALHEQGSPEQAMALSQLALQNLHADRPAVSIQDIRQIIEAAGFDSVAYINSVEDKGSWSYIVWRPELIKKLDVAEVAELLPDTSGKTRFGPSRVGPLPGPTASVKMTAARGAYGPLSPEFRKIESTVEHFLRTEGSEWSACSTADGAVWKCDRASHALANWLDVQGYKVRVVGLKFPKHVDPERMHQDFIEEGYSGTDMTHVVVEVDGYVVDLTARQFDPNATFPLIEPKATYYRNWGKREKVPRQAGTNLRPGPTAGIRVSARPLIKQAGLRLRKDGYGVYSGEWKGNTIAIRKDLVVVPGAYPANKRQQRELRWNVYVNSEKVGTVKSFKEAKKLAKSTAAKTTPPKPSKPEPVDSAPVDPQPDGFDGAQEIIPELFAPHANEVQRTHGSVSPEADIRKIAPTASVASETWYHLTDNPQFSLNPDYAPEDNAIALEDRSGRKGIYLAPDVERWVNGHGYMRPFVAEFLVDPSVKKMPGVHGRWGGEMFVPSSLFNKLNLRRVIPIDAHAREQFGEHGWIESHHGTEFDSDKPIPRPGRPGWRPGLLRDYKYPGPDVRKMSPEQSNQHRSRWRTFMKEDRGLDVDGGRVASIKIGVVGVPGIEPVWRGYRPRSEDHSDLRRRPSITLTAIEKQVVSTPDGYAYHATSTWALDDIAAQGLKPHRPWYGTDQREWPDGTTERRVYLAPSEQIATSFHPENGEPVMLRAPVGSIAGLKVERGTRDLVTTKRVPATVLEIKIDGAWMPLTQYVQRHLRNSSCDAKITRYVNETSENEMRSLSSRMVVDARVSNIRNGSQETGRKELPKGWTIVNHGAGTFSVKTKEGLEVARADIVDDGLGDYLTSVNVHPEYRRRGIASVLYRTIEDTIGRKLQPSPISQTPDGEAFWRSRQAATIAYDDESAKPITDLKPGARVRFVENYETPTGVKIQKDELATVEAVRPEGPDMSVVVPSLQRRKFKDRSVVVGPENVEALAPVKITAVRKAGSWAEYLKQLRFKTPEDARATVFRRVKMQNDQIGYMFGVEDPEDVWRSLNLELAKDGWRFIAPSESEKRLMTPNVSKRPPAGAQVPGVSWQARDLQDESAVVDKETIKGTYGKTNSRVYMGYVPIEDLQPVLAEHNDKDGDDGYDWAELRRRGSPPPPKIVIHEDGQLEIADGNHRIHFWRDRGYSHVPAWIIDNRKLTRKKKSMKVTALKRTARTELREGQFLRLHDPLSLQQEGVNRQQSFAADTTFVYRGSDGLMAVVSPRGGTERFLVPPRLLNLYFSAVKPGRPASPQPQTRRPVPSDLRGRRVAGLLPNLFWDEDELPAQAGDQPATSTKRIEFREATPEEFELGIRQVEQSALDQDRDPSQAKDLIISTDGKCGYAIGADGEMKWVWSTERGYGKAAVQNAIARGAHHLSAFDNGKLVQFYDKMGFREHKREKNWTAGEPDVVFMRLPKPGTEPVPSGPVGGIPTTAGTRRAMVQACARRSINASGPVVFKTEGRARERWAADAFRLYEKAYGAIGLNIKSPEEMLKIPIWHLAVKNGELLAGRLYKVTDFGQKAVAAFTDGTREGATLLKTLMRKSIEPGVYSEVSHAPEKIMSDAPVVSPADVAKILGKDVEPDPDNEHYWRDIANVGRVRKKMVGLPRMEKDYKPPKDTDKTKLIERDAALADEEDTGLDEHLLCLVMERIAAEVDEDSELDTLTHPR